MDYLLFEAPVRAFSLLDVYRNSSATAALEGRFRFFLKTVISGSGQSPIRSLPAEGISPGLFF